MENLQEAMKQQWLPFNRKKSYDWVASQDAYITDGEWPSGKAPGSGPGIRGFESLLPSHAKSQVIWPGFLHFS